MAQAIKRPTSAQVMISQLMGSNPMLSSVLTAQSLEPASNPVSPSLSASPPLTLSLKNKHNFFYFGIFSDFFISFDFFEPLTRIQVSFYR